MTEFLPVSSSGHLVIMQEFLGITGENLFFDVCVHFGTLMSVIFVYAGPLKLMAKECFIYTRTKKVTPLVKLFGLVVVGSLPVGIIGITFMRQIEGAFSSVNIVIFGFAVTGMFLFLTKYIAKGPINGDFFRLYENHPKLSIKNVLIVGAAQAFAILPGVSRSGSTIAAGILCGLDRTHAALLSFMLAIPAILGATILQLRHISNLSGQDITVYATGAIVSFITGVIALKIFLTSIKQGRLHYFSYYVWSLAIFLIVRIYL